MQWNELYDREHEPTESQVSEYINSPLFGELDGYLRQTYKIKPKLAYSSCAMDGGMWKGWNIKYKKGQRTVTAPMIAVVVLVLVHKIFHPYPEYYTAKDEFHYEKQC
jgi:aminopeptidase-like protein